MESFNLCNWEKFSCFGCCGYDFASRKEVEKKLNEQTKLWKSLGTKDFSKREIPYLEEEGICGHQVLVRGKAFCATHPFVEKNKGIDYREPRCKKDHLCETFIRFKQWPNVKKKEFLNFLRKKDLDWYEYSLGMDNNSFLNEFEEISSKDVPK